MVGEFQSLREQYEGTLQEAKECREGVEDLTKQFAKLSSMDEQFAHVQKGLTNTKNYLRNIQERESIGVWMTMTTLRQEITRLGNAPPPLSEDQVNHCYDWAWHRFHEVYPAR